MVTLETQPVDCYTEVVIQCNLYIVIGIQYRSDVYIIILSYSPSHAPLIEDDSEQAPAPPPRSKSHVSRGKRVNDMYRVLKGPFC